MRIICPDMHQEGGHEKFRYGNHTQRTEGYNAVQPGSGMHCRQKTDENGQRNRNEGDDSRHHQRVRQPILNKAGDGGAAGFGHTQVTHQHAAQPVEIADKRRFIQAQLRSERRQILRRGALT